MKFKDTGLRCRSLHLFRAFDCAPRDYNQPDAECEVDVPKFAAIAKVNSLKGYPNIGPKTIARTRGWLILLQSRCDHYWTGNPLACNKCGKPHVNDSREHYP